MGSLLVPHERAIPDMKYSVSDGQGHNSGLNRLFNTLAKDNVFDEEIH